MNNSEILFKSLEELQKSQIMLTNALQTLNSLNTYSKTLLNKLSDFNKVTDKIDALHLEFQSTSKSLSKQSFKEMETTVENVNHNLKDVNDKIAGIKSNYESINNSLSQDVSRLETLNSNSLTLLGQTKSNIGIMSSNIEKWSQSIINLGDINKNTAHLIDNIGTTQNETTKLIGSINSLIESTEFASMIDHNEKIESKVGTLVKHLETTERQIPIVCEVITSHITSLDNATEGLMNYTEQLNQVISSAQSSCDHFIETNVTITHLIDRIQNIEKTIIDSKDILNPDKFKKLSKYALDVNMKLANLKPELKKFKLTNQQNQSRIEEVYEFIRENEKRTLTNMTLYDEKIKSITNTLSSIGKLLDSLNNEKEKGKAYSKSILDNIQALPIKQYGNRYFWIIILQFLQIGSIVAFVYFNWLK